MATTLTKIALVAAITAGCAAFAPAVLAQNAPSNGVLVIYGNEKCPTDSNGNEIVVCKRRSQNEQFRIPKELRDFKVTPQNESWASREKSVADVGATGVGSCSVVGASGASGCFLKQAQAARKENRERAEAQSRVP